MTNRRRNKDSRRKRRASKAIEELSTVLLSYDTTDSEAVDAAARDILRIGKRHGERPESQIARLICRGCEAALIPGRNARFRISVSMLIITCEDCGRVERSGPDFQG